MHTLLVYNSTCISNIEMIIYDKAEQYYNVSPPSYDILCVATNSHSCKWNIFVICQEIAHEMKLSSPNDKGAQYE